jgi:demethylmenaquinone methyltransferase / 2-methoxy-6-polyprenyl-1,4-benzoquinol methylase
MAAPDPDRAALIPRPDAPLPTGDDKRRAVQAMFDTIAPRYDLVNRIMTLRLDVRWRRRALASLGLAPGALVADLAAGTGDLSRALLGAGMTPVAVDLSFGMLSADRSGAPRVQGDTLDLPFPDHALDGVVCGFALRNFTDLGAFFVELHRVVRSGGRVALLDASTPDNPVVRWGHGLYFGKVVPRIGGLLSNRAAYAYLPRSVSYLPPTDKLVEALRSAGFPDAHAVAMSGGIALLITATAGTEPRPAPCHGDE